MKKIFGLIVLVSLCCCSDKKDDTNETTSNEFRDLTQELSVQEFENIKFFILDHGDRQTYCERYLNNPHYSFEGFETYLNPETVRANIHSDPDSSDFNLLVIHDQNTEQQYYDILVVRQGDLEDEEIDYDYPEGMREGKVYLLNYYEYDLDSMELEVHGYLEIIKNTINSH